MKRAKTRWWGSGDGGAWSKRGWCWSGVAALLLASPPAWAQAEADSDATETTASAPQGAGSASEGEGHGPSAGQGEAQPLPPPGPHTANSVQLGIGFRYGAELNRGDMNPWGTGLGFHAGYTLPVAIYLGGSVEYFFGGSQLIAGAKLKSNAWQLSAEGGYDIGLGEHFVIRPKLGLGTAAVRSKFETCPSAGLSCEQSSAIKPLLAPGATFMLFTSHFSLALDVRYAHVVADPA